jgi:hypothetical protein
MTNGQLYSFATASLLDNIPVLHVVTDVLDANKRSDMADIARMLAKVKTFTATKAIELQRCSLGVRSMSAPPSTFTIDCKQYHIKLKKCVYNRFDSRDEENGALPLLWDVFEALADVEGVEKALGYGDLDVVGKQRSRCLVFHNLGW